MAQRAGRSSALSLSVLLDSRSGVEQCLQLLTDGLGLAEAWPVSTPPSDASHQAFAHAVCPTLRHHGAVTAGVWLPGGGGSDGPPVLLELVELPWLSQTRRWARRQERARLLQIAVGVGTTALNSTTATTSDQPAIRWGSLPSWMTQDDPAPVPAFACLPHQHLPSSKATPPHDELGLVGLREVVLGHASTDAAQHAAFAGAGALSSYLAHSGTKPQGVAPGSIVWPLRRSEDGQGLLPVLRVLPSPTSVLVLQVANLEAAQRALQHRGCPTDLIGRSSAQSSTGQLVVRLPRAADGLEVRLCEQVTVSPFFCEGSRTLMEGVIVESSADDGFRQDASPPRGGEAALPLQQDGGRVGDCWMELRAMMKHPEGFFKGR